MDDVISRQVAIDAANDWLLDCLKVKKQDRSCGLIRRLEDLPSAQPEQRWIPCYPSDLPKNMELWVTHDNKYYRWVDTVHWDMTTWSDDVSDVVAYMPYIVPKPYKEGENDKTD